MLHLARVVSTLKSVSARPALLLAAGAALSECARLAVRYVRLRSARLAAAASLGEVSVSVQLRTLPPSTLYAGKHALAPLMKRAGMAVLSGGVPPAVTFPLRGLTVTAAQDGGASSLSIELTSAEVALSQRYAPFAWDALRLWLDAHVQALHAPPPSGGHRVCVTAGSMSGLAMLASVLLDRGDVVLIEDRSFMAAIDVFKSAGATLVLYI